ncbi:glycosyltransferase family 9 protein [Aureitalea marina]|uniref:ADP-heptose--LPS heptosyltransferase n=1 Tax=Aureitalea marina TaxID=930804 RepID=A0A2S7KQ74_9FLAO|nr:glycosyltransferase family 9 protein [Aureitalea marina]PQB04723.1 ADP-heptose--LPS heptosyltransferase [Aureitalea marina]
MKQILVIQNKRIGDVLISSVLANNLKKVFPDSHITYFVYDYTVGVLQGNPNIDHIEVANDKELKKFGVLISTIRQIRKKNYDIIFDPYAKLQSRLMCLFSGADYRIGFVRPGKRLPLPFYTHPVPFIKTHSRACGKAIENRINLIDQVFPLEMIDDVPRIHLEAEERQYRGLNEIKPPVVMVGVLGSTAIKSMPYDYIVQLIDGICERYAVTLLFNYAPHQKEEALKIYQACRYPDQINMEIYEDSIRGFVKLMNQCDLLVANEGGSVHIAKALNKPTFTIYSPYIEKVDWNSFEDGIIHNSMHLLDEKPELYDGFTREQRKAIEQNPETMYRELTPEMIAEKLTPFLDNHLKASRK